MNKEERQESSVPAQCRVSIVTLAQLTAYWKGQGYEIRTISQLMAWSLDLLKDILSNNGQIGLDPSIGEAANYMMEKKLYQRGTFDRSRQKLSAAIRFEGMRQNGEHPMQSPNPQDRVAYRMMHRAPNQFTGAPSTVEPFTGRINSVEDSNIERAMEIMERLPEGDHSILHELSGVVSKIRNESILVEGTSAEELARRIAEDDKANLEVLNNFDPMSLIGSAKKE